MLVAAAVCPCPPLLVPDVAAGAAPELAAARAACTDVIGVLAAARPDRLVVIGPADESGRGPHPQGTRGSFQGFGVDLDVRLGAALGTNKATNKATDEDPDHGTDQGTDASRDAGGVPERSLPPSLAVAAWLLERAGWPDAPIEGLGVGEPLAPERCIHIGRDIAAGADRVALLVMGDASAGRTLKAPGYLDERAAPFDAEVARALGAADVAALKTLDADLAYELKASGRAPWQVLAGAAESAGLGGTLLYEDAPYGVGYVVATWS